MEPLNNLFSWDVSARDPIVMVLLVVATLGLASLFVTHPRLYLPLLLLTAPLPKIFTIAQYETWGSRQAAAGFSAADLILSAGLAALLLRGWRCSRTPASAAFGRSLMWWSGSVALSVGVGLMFWPGTYASGNCLYAIRYLLTLLSYWAAARYAMHARDEQSMRALLRRLAVAGNVTVALGLLYYFTIGSTAGGSMTKVVTNADATVFRSYLFFFDYGIDMGYYAVTIAILDMILLSGKRTLGWFCLAGGGVIACVTAILLLGERVNVLVLAVSLGYFLLETSRARHRSVRVSPFFRMACLFVVVGAGIVILNVVAPHAMIGKLDAVKGNEFASQAMDVMKTANVPLIVSTTVASLPMGDFTIRLALNIASLWFFFQHPAGVGFWGEWSVVGWFAHHEIVKIAVEQSIPGLVTFVWLLWALRGLLWTRGNLPGSGGQLGVLLRSVSIGFLVALLAANTVVLDMKFAEVYWSLVGLWSVLPRVRPSHPVIESEEAECLDPAIGSLS